MTTRKPVPAGYTLVRGGIWTLSTKEEKSNIILTRYPYLNAYITVGDGGVSRFKTDYVDEWGFLCEPIPDSQHPPEGMSEHHTVFDESTQKWTLPSIEDDIHAHHESQHDSDVALAHDNMCIADSMLTLVKVIEANLNGDQLAIARGKLGDFYDCIESLIDNSAIALITTAHIKSVGHITLPATPQGQHQKALDFATAFNTYLKSRTAGQLGGARYRYTLRLRTELIADAERVDSARFLPKEVSIGASGVTAASVFTKLKALLNPPS